MKIFQFYFITNLTFSLLVLILSLDTPFHFLRHRLSDIVLLCAFLCMVLQLLSVLQTVNVAGERNWVRAMFVPLPASAFFLLISVSMEFYEDSPFGHIPNLWIRIVLVLFGLGVLLFLVGCFLVRSQRVARGLRIWAVCLIAVIASLAVTIYNESHLQSALINYLVTFEIGVLFVPLLPLQYRLWKRDPNLERLEAEARAIGEPENPSE
jgi:hypothetical protein